MRYRCELALPEDDLALRRLMASTPMRGDISLTFLREPNYFEADCVLGARRETLIIRDREKDEIVSVATRAARRMFVAGDSQVVGYLGGLRVAKGSRNRGLLVRGFRYLRERHESDPDRPAFYLTTIAEDNTAAIEALTSGRAGLPTYHPLRRLRTFLIPVQGKRRSCSAGSDSGVQVKPLSDLAELLEFLRDHGSRRMFFPDYQPTDFGGDKQTGVDCTFRNLDSKSILVAHRMGRIVAAAGLWDQRAYRQTVVQEYPRMIAASRPILNLWWRSSHGIQLPKVGEPLGGCYISFPVIRDDDPNLFRVDAWEFASDRERRPSVRYGWFL